MHQTMENLSQEINFHLIDYNNILIQVELAYQLKINFYQE